MKTANTMQHEVVNVPSNIIILCAALAIVIGILVDDLEIGILLQAGAEALIISMASRATLVSAQLPIHGVRNSLPRITEVREES
jgi:hypothetical protein